MVHREFEPCDRRCPPPARAGPAVVSPQALSIDVVPIGESRKIEDRWPVGPMLRGSRPIARQGGALAWNQEAPVPQASGGRGPGRGDGRGRLPVPRGQVVPGGPADDRAAEPAPAVSRHDRGPGLRRASRAVRPARLHPPRRRDDQCPRARPRAPDGRLRVPAAPASSRRGSRPWEACSARLGRFAVLGNHDHWESGPASLPGARRGGDHPHGQHGHWLERHGARLRICGVGDLWTDRQDLRSALADATADDAVILLSHNPDFAETIRDPRVGLMLSGHTHGGQVCRPRLRRPDRPLARTARNTSAAWSRAPPARSSSAAASAPSAPPSASSAGRRSC